MREGGERRTILEVEGLGLELGGRRLLHDVSFTLEAGEWLAVVGPNGAGKTLLLRALLGLIAHSGSVRWAPETRLGYVPQKIDADRQLPIHLGNLLEAQAAVLGRPAEAAAAKARELNLGAGLLHTPVGLLSGGEFQRGLLALALVGDPNVLLLDEPTASLDEPGQERFYELLQRLRRQRGMTVILVSHDLSTVYAEAGRVLCLQGTVLCAGPPHEVLTPESLQRLFGAPARFYHTDHNHRS